MSRWQNMQMTKRKDFYFCGWKWMSFLFQVAFWEIYFFLLFFFCPFPFSYILLFPFFFFFFTFFLFSCFFFFFSYFYILNITLNRHIYEHTHLYTQINNQTHTCVGRFWPEIFVGVILARGKFIVSEEDGCNICVFTLSCFLTKYCYSLANSC